MTKKHWENMEWFCFRWDINQDKLVWFDVLSHGLLEDIEKAYKKGKITNRAEFSEIVKSWVRYHYWCKAEHEVLIADFTSKPSWGYKMDVFEQLVANWNIFIDYLISGLELDFKNKCKRRKTNE